MTGSPPAGALPMADDNHVCGWRLVASYWDEDQETYVIGEVCDGKDGCNATQERTSQTHP